MKTEQTKWYLHTDGRNEDVVISTRIRLARNIEGFPFPHRLSAEQRKQVCAKVKEALCSGNSALSASLKYIELSALSNLERISLVERHLVSPEFVSHPDGRALILSDDESISIMLCEEDHIRLQVLSSGENLKKAYEEAARLDKLLGETLKLSFSRKLGYLTACPTNLGTALRASVMLHLPALESGGALRRYSDYLQKLGLTIRGVYGEGSGSKASMYQISNETTLGVSEVDSVDKLVSVCDTLTEAERKARASMISREDVQDTLWRSLGVLRTARRISSDEFASLFSNVRLATAGKLYDGVTLEALGRLFVQAQPATLSLRAGKELSASERDTERAKLIREALK